MLMNSQKRVRAARRNQHDLPVQGTCDIDAPVQQVWQLFGDVPGWAGWNPCIAVARTVPSGPPAAGSTLLWAFRPIRRRYLYRLPAVARLTDVIPGREVTWEVTAVPGFHARHTYSFEDLGDGRCRFGSWEQASGPVYRLLRPFWLAHFRFVRDASLSGMADAMRRHEGAARLVRQSGATTGVPLVVVPGMDGSRGTLAPLVERLSRSRPTFVVDYTTERNPRLEDLSGEIARLVRTELTGQVDVLATSLGAVVAAQAIGDHGLEARRAVLIGAFTRVRDAQLRANNLLISVLPRSSYRLLSPWVLAWVCGPVGDGWRHPFFRHIRASDPVQVAKRTRWEVGRDFSTELAKIAQPTLILMGSRDRFVKDLDSEIRILRRLFRRPGSEVREVPAAGHVFLPSAAVDTAVEAAEDFLDGAHSTPGEREAS